MERKGVRGVGGPRNTLSDLNNHLFEQLERLNDAESEDEIQQELSRSKAVSDIAKNVIDNGKLVLEAQRFKHDDRMDANRSVPRMLEGNK